MRLCGRCRPRGESRPARAWQRFALTLQAHVRTAPKLARDAPLGYCEYASDAAHHVKTVNFSFGSTTDQFDGYAKVQFLVSSSFINAGRPPMAIYVKSGQSNERTCKQDALCFVRGPNSRHCP